MELEYLYYFVWFSLLLFLAGLWFAWQYAKKKSKMLVRLSGSLDKGSLIAEYKWGDAKLNGVHLKNCVKISNYDNGLLVSVLPFFFFGDLWLPREELVIGELQGKRFLMPESRLIKSQMNELILFGKLAKLSGIAGPK